MCGIVHVRRHDGHPARKVVRKLYERQKGRGTEGFGYVAIKDNEIVSYERAPTEHEIMEKLSKEDAPEILFHHRFPTSGPNVEEMAHPIRVAHEKLKHQYFVAHNGVIRNYHKRKEAHEKLGFKYVTELEETLKSKITGKLYNSGFSKFNDSESLAIDTALAIEKGINFESEGASAVVGLTVDGTHVIDRFFYRNFGNPLYLERSKHMTTLTSQVKGVEVPSTHIMHFDEAGEMEEHPSKKWVPSVYGDTYRESFSGNKEFDAFGHRIQPKIIQLLGPSDEDDVNYSDSEDYLGVEASKMDDGERNELKKTVETYTELLLWEEYKKCTDGILELEGMIEDMPNTGFVNAIMVDKRRKLVLRVGRCKQYQELLEGEITERDAFNKSLSKIS